MKKVTDVKYTKNKVVPAKYSFCKKEVEEFEDMIKYPGLRPSTMAYELYVRQKRK